MLSKINRFHGHGSVRRVYRTGRPVRTGLLSLHAQRGDKIRKSKAAVVVSRKVHKSAVKRNRIRRRIYEYVRLRLPELKAPTQLVITVYTPDLAEMPVAEFTKAMDELFKRAKLN